MYGWTFSARTADELACLLEAMGKHRYLSEADLRIHWSLDSALAHHHPAHREAAERFKSTLNLAGEIEVVSRDPRLWRPSSAAEVARVLELLWGPEGPALAQAIEDELRRAGFPRADAPPFGGDPDEPPHPELVLLDWVLLPVDELDSERHRGALRAMELMSDEVEASAPVFVEGPTLGEAELCRGAPHGVLPCDPTFWADGPYGYVDYVFRGVSRAAALVDPPVGYRDVESQH